MNLIEALERDFLPVLLLRGALVLAGAYCVAFALRRRGGATLRMTWTVALLVLFALPFSFLFEGWHLPVGAPASEPVMLATEPREVIDEAPPMTVDALAFVPDLAMPAADVRTPYPVIALIWLGGVGVGLLYLLAGRLILLRLQFGMKPADDSWDASAARIAAGLGLRRVRVRFVKHVRVPMTTGVFRPEILVPDSARDFGERRREAVLLHELTHVAGRDPLVLMLASVAVAVHWMNPLAWLAARALRFAQERVCDDAVLKAEEGGAEDYADLLVDVARNGGRNRFPASAGLALMMAHNKNKSSLKRRIHLILDKTMKRKTLTKPQRLLVTAVVLAVSVPMALIGFGDPAPQEESDERGPENGTETVTATGEATLAADETAVDLELDETAYIEEKLKRIIIPMIDFEGATIAEGIEFLRMKSIELDSFETDPAMKGINFVLLREANRLGRLAPRNGPNANIRKLEGRVDFFRAKMLEMAEKHGILEGQESVDTEIYKEARSRLAKAMLEIENLRNRVRTLQNLDGDDLVKWLVAQDGTSALARQFESYSARKIELQTLSRKDGTVDPQDKELEKEVELLKKTLLESVEDYKKSLGTQLMIQEHNLKSAMEHERSAVDEVRNRARRSVDYAEAKRAYEMRLELLQAMRKKELVQTAAVVEPTTVTLKLSNIPLGTALKYITLQAGMRLVVQPHAVVIGTSEEIAVLE